MSRRLEKLISPSDERNRTGRKNISLPLIFSHAAAVLSSLGFAVTSQFRNWKHPALLFYLFARSFGEKIENDKLKALELSEINEETRTGN